MSTANTQQPLSVPGDLDTESAWGAFARHNAAALSETLTLRNGAIVRMRAIQPSDLARLQEFHARLSSDTIILRYFRVAPILYERDAKRLTHLDYHRRMALVATTGEGESERIIGVVRYEPDTATEAELAFVVEDCWQGLGISSKLLQRLIRYAQEHGYKTLSAITMATNVRMRAVLAHTGYPTTSRYEDGCLRVTLDIAPLTAPTGH
ncbi:MAG TPA: GNAT family N-acetyltransferase [Ktedonobacterales bacterium]